LCSEPANEDNEIFVLVKLKTPITRSKKEWNYQMLGVKSLCLIRRLKEYPGEVIFNMDCCPEGVENVFKGEALELINILKSETGFAEFNYNSLRMISSELTFINHILELKDSYI
jgi:hypothetical protein